MTTIAPEKKPSFPIEIACPQDSKYIIGFKRPEGFDMVDVETVTRQGVIDRKVFDFDVQIGRLKVGENVYNDTFLVEVHLDRIDRDISRARLLGGFGSHTYADCIDVAMPIVGAVLKEKGLKAFDYLNGWPTLRFIADRSTTNKDA